MHAKERPLRGKVTKATTGYRQRNGKMWNVCALLGLSQASWPTSGIAEEMESRFNDRSQPKRHQRPRFVWDPSRHMYVMEGHDRRSSACISRLTCTAKTVNRAEGVKV